MKEGINFCMTVPAQEIDKLLGVGQIHISKGDHSTKKVQTPLWS